ncbi:MAG TPA: FAD-dependent oxidoreductase, partial [Minicystis sp.]|nr:FAD-dependent oxidoreductase [Minicystis sp.]
MDGEATPRAVVVGAGVGGAAAALLLAASGVRTTLVDKNRRLGGSCSGYEKQGFHVDVGTHMFCRGDKGPLGEVLWRAGRPGAIRFVRTRDIAEVRFPARPGDANQQDGVTRIAVPADLARMPRFVVELVRALALSPREAARAARLFAHILAMSDADVDALDGATVEDFIAPFTDHPPTIGLFGFLLGLYFILPYWEVSAGEALWSFRAMVRDNALSYPLGGSIAVPGTYARIAEELGADVRTGAGVRRVVVDRSRVRGVELEDGSVLPASIVVSTSSVRTTVTRLVGPQHFPEAYVARALALRGSYVAVQAKIGLRKKLVDAGAIIGGVGDGVDLLRVSTGELREMFAALADGKIPPVVPFYCPVPTNFDPSLAPPGHQLLTACAVAPTTDVALRDPAPLWEEAMLATLRKVVPGLDEHAVFVDRFSVAFLERWLGKEFGPAVSTGQTPDQVGKKRPAVHTPVRGLYLAGCGAGARGVGTELAASSAMECVDRILADLGRPLLARASRGPRDAAAKLAARA